MRSLLRVAVIGFAIAVVHFGAASAALLNLPTQDPRGAAGSAIVDYLEFGGDGDLSIFGAFIDAQNGIDFGVNAEISLGLGFPLSDPTDSPSGGFDIFGDSGFLLGGDLLRLGFGTTGPQNTSVIEIEFGNIEGVFASDFGSSVAMLIAFDDDLGDNPFDMLVDGGSYNASVAVSAIPLPATFPLLLMALGFFGFMMRRSRTV